MVAAEVYEEVKDHRNCNSPTCLDVEASRGMITMKRR